MPNQFSGLPVEDRAAATEDARRESRFKFAEDRIRKIVSGAPRFTDDQLRRLAILLAPDSR